MPPASSITFLHCSVLLLNEENKLPDTWLLVREQETGKHWESLLCAHPWMGSSLFYIAGLVHKLLFLFLSVHGLLFASFCVLPGYLVMLTLQHCIQPCTLGSCPAGICSIPEHCVICWCIYTTLAEVFNVMTDYPVTDSACEELAPGHLSVSIPLLSLYPLDWFPVHTLWLGYQGRQNAKNTRESEVFHTHYFSFAT